jgi:hypothetical protein
VTGAAVALLLSCASATHAANRSWDTDSPARTYDEEEIPWAEQGVALPEYPDKNHLIHVPIEIAGSSLDMFIDERSLSIGDDGVVRYVLVLRAQSGAENVFFEGIRCATHELRSYAYGTSRLAWQSVDTAWTPLSGLGVGRYRKQLYQYYLCHPTLGILPRQEMLQRMRYGVPHDD